MKKIIIPIIIIISLIIPFTVSAIELIVKYPALGGPTPEQGLGAFLRYLYIFGLAISGIAAMLAIIIGAIFYVTSAGSPEKMAKAKNIIFSAIGGVILLLAAYLILNTINPDLISLKLPTLEPVVPPEGSDLMSPPGYACQIKTGCPKGSPKDYTLITICYSTGEQCQSSCSVQKEHFKGISSGCQYKEKSCVANLNRSCCLEDYVACKKNKHCCSGDCAWWNNYCIPK